MCKNYRTITLRYSAYVLTKVTFLCVTHSLWVSIISFTSNKEQAEIKAYFLVT